MAKRSWSLIAALPLSISPSWGADFYYHRQEKSAVYVAEQKGERDGILSELPGVSFSCFWRIANLANNQGTCLLSDFNPDKSDCDDRDNCQHIWLTDGRSVLWSGEVLKNPPGEPGVDAAGFQALGAFAAGKRNVCFDGQRIDDRWSEYVYSCVSVANKYLCAEIKVSIGS